MKLTTKQIHLLTVIRDGNPDGRRADLDQILIRLPYETTKQSLQFSIRALIRKGLIQKEDAEKRRGKRRRVIGLTDLGKLLLNSEDKMEK